MNARQIALFPDLSTSSSTSSAYTAGGEGIKHLPSKHLLIKQTVHALRRGDARPEAIETLLRRLRGGSLIVAVLSYDLGVRISNLIRLRIRDVQLSRREIYLDGRELKIPSVIIDDLREHIGGLLCGLDASDVAGKRDQPLFPAEVTEHLRRECAIWCKRFGTLPVSEHGQECLGELPDVATDAFLRLSGRWHKRIALRRGLRVSSPLDLFDKGPRIVRRRTAGLIDAYYMWRATPAY